MLIDTRDSHLDRDDPSLPPADVVSLTAGVSLAVGLIHAAAAPGHFKELWLYGVLFAVVAVAQLAWAVLLYRRPEPRLMRRAAIGNALVIGAWIVAHSIGIPFGREGVETMGTLGIMATIDEVFLVLTPWLLPAVALRGSRGDRRRYEYAAIALSVASFSALLLAGGHH